MHLTVKIKSSDQSDSPTSQLIDSNQSSSASFYFQCTFTCFHLFLPSYLYLHSIWPLFISKTANPAAPLLCWFLILSILAVTPPALLPVSCSLQAIEKSRSCLLPLLLFYQRYLQMLSPPSIHSAAVHSCAQVFTFLTILASCLIFTVLFLAVILQLCSPLLSHSFLCA